jgi:hypothetical protein
MRKIFVAFLIIISASFILTSCNKYEDGNNLSFRSAKERVINNWRLTSITINGVEKVGLAEYLTQEQIWLPDGNYTQTFINPITGTGERIDGTWELQDDNKKVALTKFNQITGKIESAVIYNILKLYENEIWLRSTDNSTEMHLETAK